LPADRSARGLAFEWSDPVAVIVETNEIHVVYRAGEGKEGRALDGGVGRRGEKSEPALAYTP